MTKGSRILVVEDEMVISIEIATTLKRLGYEVAGQAITGADAVRMAGEVDPDLILMDIRLKGEMDGIEAASYIKELSDHPIIFLTAHSDEATLERAIAISPSGYLIKPFKDRELYSSIELALHKHDIRQRLRPERVIRGKVPEDIADMPGVCLVTINSRGTITRVNKASSLLFGAEMTDIVGTRITGWIFRNESTGNGQGRGSVIMPGSASLRRQDGEMQPVRLEAGFIVEEDGMVQGYLLALYPASVCNGSVTG